MAVNNEVGTIQPIGEMASLLQLHPTIIWHVDGVQAVTTQFHLLLEPRIDCISLSAHKFHGVRGVGIFVKKARVVALPLLYGGGQEFGLRSSTENLPAIAASAKALRLMVTGKDRQLEIMKQYSLQLKQSLKQNGFVLFGGDETSDHIICTALPGIPGEVMLNVFAENNIFISTTSACSSRAKSSHHTLGQMKISPKLSKSAVRLSLSDLTTQVEIDQTLFAIEKIATQFLKTKEQSM